VETNARTRKGVYWLLVQGVACGGCLACSACVILSGSYPKDWAQPERHEAGCEQVLTGIYAMTGVEATTGFWFTNPKTTPVRLDTYLMPDSRPDADRIEIVGPDDGKLVISAEQGTTVLELRTINENTDYQCDKGAILIRGNPDTTPWYNRRSFVSKSVRYSKAVDGSLIIRRKTIGAGAIAYLPIFESNEDWSRFPALQLPAVTAPSGAIPDGLPIPLGDATK
jgi:hypothetical protein